MLAAVTQTPPDARVARPSYSPQGERRCALTASPHPPGQPVYWALVGKEPQPVSDKAAASINPSVPDRVTSAIRRVRCIARRR